MKIEGSRFMVLGLLAALLLSSCVYADKERAVAMGGKGAYNGRDFSLVWDNDESFRSAITGAVAVGGLYYGAAQHAATEATARAANANATKQAINASNNATKIASEGIAADVTKATVLPK